MMSCLIWSVLIGGGWRSTKEISWEKLRLFPSEVDSWIRLLGIVGSPELTPSSSRCSSRWAEGEQPGQNG